MLNQTPKDWLGGQNFGSGLPAAGGIGFFTDKLVPFLISGSLFLVIVLSLVFTLVGAIMLMTSGGNKEGTAKAKNTITYALIGLVLGLVSFIIIGLLSQFFQFDLGLGRPFGRQCMVSRTDYNKFCSGTIPPTLREWCAIVKNDCGY